MTDALNEKLVPKGSSLEHKTEHATEKPKTTKEVKEKASKILHTESGESSESQEAAEFGDGRVSEGLGDKDQAPAAGGGAKRSYTTDEIEAIRAKLLAAAPPEAVMIRQIKNKLIGEEKVLTKKMKTLKKRADRNAFHLAIVVGQLRKVREYFALLAHATFEAVKHLWLKIVHGV